MSLDDADLEDAAPLRPRLKPLLLAAALNVAVAVGLLGWPYYRGQLRAEASAAGFATFAACLFDGSIADRHGLALPRGERARFADLALGGGAWPARCRDELRAIAPEPVILLFPSVKGAENETRAAVERVDRALGALIERREERRVPMAALDALGHLQAALVEQTRAAGVDTDPLREVVVLGEREARPAPSIVPLRTASGSEWVMGLDGSAIVVTSWDARSVEQVRIDDGRVEQRRARRPRLASVIGGREPPWIVWATPRADCQRDPRRCAQRTMGLARFTDDRQELAPAIRVNAHPFESLAGAAYVDGDSVWVASVGAPPNDMVLRRFSLEEGSSGASLEEVPLEVSGARAVHWIEASPPALVWAGDEGAGVATVSGEAHALEASGSIIASSDDWLAIAGRDRLWVAQAHGGDPAIAVDAGAEDVRVLALGERAEVWLLDGGDLRRARCDESACALDPEPFASHVTRFDAVRFREASHVAWTTGAEMPVHVARVSGERVETSLPAACWSPAGGLCGPPRLVADGERLVLAVRESSNLRVLESADGSRWRALTGLEQP